MSRNNVGLPGGARAGIAAFGNGVHRAEDDQAKRRRQAVGEHHGGSFGVYMAHKIQKLRAQNDHFVGHDETAPWRLKMPNLRDGSAAQQGDGAQDHDGKEEEEKEQEDNAAARGTSRTLSARGTNDGVESGSHGGALFAGVHVFVDGYTVPSKEEIRSLMLELGGGFEHYETSRVTHVIATHLATSKLLQYKKMRHPPPVVSPDWIVKSIEAKELLPVQPFLYKAFADPTQGSVLSSLSLSGSSSKSQLESPAKLTKQAGPLTDPVDVVTQRNLDQGLVDEEDHDSFSEHEGASDEEDHEALATQYASQNTATLDEDDGGDEDRQLQGRPSSRDADTHRTNSTRDGPSFVRHFFAKSRLHHIGSWRTTFQLRAPAFLAKYQGERFRQEPPTSSDRVILHVDMDCFFVSVAVRDKPEYNNLPIAIAHSGNAGSSEISSCNYLARAKGLRAGMFMQSAKKLCPELVVLPYQFEEIEACSFQIYDIFFSRTPYVQAMSCDEAYLEFGKGTDGVKMATELRKAIFEKTRCTASVGVSYNILLAKLATREAKPDGLFEIATPEQAEPFLQSLKISDLPGVGHRMKAKMDEFGLEDIEQLRTLSKTDLIQRLGKSTGETLFNYARGIDHRPLSVESNMMRKSVSAVVNFGIRFQTWNDATEFMMALAEELSSRLKSLKLRGKCLTLLVKKRREGAAVVPTKFMGMGICDSFSKSQILSEATDSDLIIGRCGIELLRQYRFPIEDLRGVGIQATKLVSTIKSSETKTGERFRAWLADSESSGRSKNADPDERREPAAAAEQYTESYSQINMEVLGELPPDIRDEVLASYSSRRPPPATHAPPTFSLERPRAKGKQRAGTTTLASNRASLFQNGHSSAKVTEPGNTLNDIRMSQVDEDVYHALPFTIRREIDAHAKRSKGATNIRSSGAQTAPKQPAPQTYQQAGALRTIEELSEALSDAVATIGDIDSVVDSSLEAHASFDAIFSRILLEIEGQALDKALRMLRFVRRKCQSLATQFPHSSSQIVRNGFNLVLSQINSEMHHKYRSSFPARLVAPL